MSEVGAWTVQREERLKREVCPYCGTRGNETRSDEFERMLRECTNCIVDVMMQGEWTGHGWSAFKSWAEAHGLDPVAAAARMNPPDDDDQRHA